MRWHEQRGDRGWLSRGPRVELETVVGSFENEADLLCVW